MRYLFVLLCCVTVFFAACKKESSCPTLQGKWMLTEIWIDQIKTVIPDTSAGSETLEIKSDNTFISSSTKTGKLWNSGTFDCSKIFDADSISFKKGSDEHYNLYIRK